MKTVLRTEKKVATPLPLIGRKGETDSQTRARAVLSPAIQSASTALLWTSKEWQEGFDIADAVTVMANAGERVNKGDLSEIEAALTNQAMALNALFANLALRAKLNVSEYPDAFERYLRLALKAQNQSRMTMETLANVKNPRMVFAKQANINNGGQQQVNNGVALRTHATQNETTPNKLVEHSNETPMDAATAGSAGNQDSQMETVDAFNGSENT